MVHGNLQINFIRIQTSVCVFHRDISWSTALVGTQRNWVNFLAKRKRKKRIKQGSDWKLGFPNQLGQENYTIPNAYKVQIYYYIFKHSMGHTLLRMEKELCIKWLCSFPDYENWWWSPSLSPSLLVCVLNSSYYFT